jgi:nucleotide-binding universal stress UspA family protein
MYAAKPFLENAEEVVVVTVGEVDTGTPSCADAASYLEHCGVKVISKEVDWPKRPVAERILNQAEAHNCDLVVMGGYSHARLFETMLGGVTRHMLGHADRSILMAH